MLDNVKSRFTAEIDKLGGASKVAVPLGVARATVYNWCSSGNAPMDKLLLLGELGLDVSYVLTGTRTIPAEKTLSQSEQAIIEHYRKTDEVGQRAIEQTASALAQSTQKAAGKKRA